ncbi:MAG TPA: M24 family metallopeptidase [Magnetospirillaceae bacterium]|jgi:Xaa-Pro aminopeptidase
MTALDRIPVRISDVELNRRWSAVRTAMGKHGVDALVMQNTNDWLGGYVKWFTDIPANNGYPRSIIFHADGPMTVIEMGPAGHRKKMGGDDPIHRGIDEMVFSPSFSSIAYTEGDDARLVAEELKHRSYRRIGWIGGGFLPHAFRQSIEAALGTSATFVEAADLVDPIKAIKSAEEQTLIRKAAALQDAVFEKVLGAIKPGMRDVDVTALAWREGQVLGSEQGVFLGFSSPMGRFAGFAGRHLQGRTLQPGDHLPLLIEINGPGGFYTEIARTIVLGLASQELLDGFAVVKAAQDAALKRMKPGTLCRDIAAAHDAYMNERGLPAELRVYSHGQGYDMVERPLIRADESMAIAEGMCFSVHPGYDTPTMFAMICDNYLIGPNGPGECLHRTEKKIFEV